MTIAVAIERFFEQIAMVALLQIVNLAYTLATSESDAQRLVRAFSATARLQKIAAVLTAEVRIA